ncbi:HAMP domain-containing histidine kinase [Clostridium sp. YIM B02515]|uniref:histidine kinase n=1 Tax=Clostridium rhizosphaerae TaxID=2803861 RepID=A0ABS1TG65_9CLOT|nr:HAMP domain-containing sensor histidine kinase [Clostridium rhizosphaerae]MBL4938364.1 HAMP domain-containing histidine kinase [Clostridium rhizosphaerae]
MQTIRKRLSILFVICSISAIFIITLFVNLTINNKFDLYMKDIQDKRYERIVSYFQEVYKRDGKWIETSGAELMHEAYMGNYCLSLLDSDKKVIWGMDPNDIRNSLHFKTMITNDKGVYSTKTFEIVTDNKVVGYVNIGQYSSVLMSEEDVNFKTSINKSIIASGLTTLIIVIAISLYFSKQFSMPIKEVANMYSKLSKGDFDTKLKTRSNIEELESLRRNVNILAGKLKQQDMLRKRLVADISHEIRTPLNILQNNLEAMIDGIFPVTTERLNGLNEEVIRFSRLLDNLNVLKQFEAESEKLNFEKIALDDLIKGVCSDFYMEAENKKIDLICDLQNNKHYYITGDKDKLKQVFINLISNAIKFTGEGGKVTVAIYEKENRVMAEIIDNGIGIEERDLPFIYERLYRGDISRHKTEGSGIGLTIVRNIINLHSAGIEVQSSLGEGTKVIVTFQK